MICRYSTTTFMDFRAGFLLKAAVFVVTCLKALNGAPQWPDGNYGLPMPIHGCPSNTTKTWKSGYIKQALGEKSKKSVSFHLKAEVTSKYVMRSFCMTSSQKTAYQSHAWPKGKYCIYRNARSKSCPSGLKPGILMWDNRFVFNVTEAMGAVPKGLTSVSSTSIHFCCAIYGDVTKAISLPVDWPFYLLAGSQGKCQEVEGTINRMENIYFDTEGKNTLTAPYPYTANELYINTHYCYYQGFDPPRWPQGNYTLPKPTSGCPDNDDATWSTGTLSQPLKTNNGQSTSLHMAANVTYQGVERSFCTKKAVSMDTSRPQWPTGKYCIYRHGDSCPVGLSRGSLLWHNRIDFTGFSKSLGILPDGIYTGSVTLLYFCCSVNGNKSHPIPLPLEKPFYLMAYESDVCQEVIGTLSRPEYIFYSTGGSNKLAPYHPYKAAEFYMKIYYCYYQACWSNFTSLSGTIMSPFYPTDYPKSINCKWSIVLPRGYQITLHFDEVDLEPSSLCIKDWLSVRYGAGNDFRYCKKTGVYRDLETKSNHVVLEFYSDQNFTANRGFKISYTSSYSHPATTSTFTTQLPTTTSTTQATYETTPGPTYATTPAKTTHQVPSSTTTHQPNNTDATETLQTTRSEATATRHTTDSTATNRVEISSTQAISPLIAREARQAQSYDAWTIIVAVSLVLLIAAIVMVVVYFKCLRKRSGYPDNIRRRSVIKYCKKEEGDYVDMDYASDAIFGDKSNPGIPVYDNYPSDNEGEEINRQTEKQEAVNPIYEAASDEYESMSLKEKSQNNILYESQSNSGNNVYEELPNPRMKENNIYESASLPTNHQK